MPDDTNSYSLADALKKFKTPLPDVSVTPPKTAQPAPEKTPNLEMTPPPKEEKPTVQPVKEYSFKDALKNFAPNKPKSTEDMVQEAARRYGVDSDLAMKLAKRESGFNQKAVSRAGARGVMQLMPATASQYGVNIDDMESNIGGGMRYLHDLIDRYDDTDKALAAYNWGPDRVDKAIEKYGKDWLAHAPEETQKYVGALTSKGYTTPAALQQYMPQIYGKRGLEPRIAGLPPEPEKKSGLPPPWAVSGFYLLGKKAAEKWGEYIQPRIEHAVSFYEENFPWRHINAQLLAGSLASSGIDQGFSAEDVSKMREKVLKEGYRDPYKELEQELAKPPKERDKAKVAKLAEETKPTQFEKFEHRALTNVFNQGSDPVNVAFMFFPLGRVLEGAGLSAKAALFTRSAVDAGFTGYAATGAIEGVRRAWDQFDRGETGEGFASLLDAATQAGFGYLGAHGAIHQVRSGMSLHTMDRLAHETYGKDWMDLPMDQRHEISQRVSDATAKYRDVITEIGEAERKRDIAAYVKAAEKLGVDKGELASLRKDAAGARPAPESRIKDTLDRLKKILEQERTGKAGVPVEDMEREKSNEVLDFLFNDNPAKVKDAWQRWQSIREGEAEPLTIEAKAEAERMAVTNARNDLLREIVDSEKRLQQKIYEEASRNERERAAMRGDLEAAEKRQKERIRIANQNLRDASPVLQRKEAMAGVQSRLETARTEAEGTAKAGAETEALKRMGETGREAAEAAQRERGFETKERRGFEEPPTELEGVARREEGLVEGRPAEDERMIRDAITPHVGDARYRLENLIGHVNDFIETRKRPTTDAEIREELERLGREADKEEFARTAEMAEVEEERLARERGWAFKGRRRGMEETGLDLTPDQETRLENDKKSSQVMMLGQMKQVLNNEAARLSERVTETTSNEEAAELNKTIEAAHKAASAAEQMAREIIEELPEEEKPDPDRDRDAATIPDEFLGATISIKTSRGYSVEAQYAVLEAGAVQASHDTNMDPNPMYPTRVQPRNREAAFSAAHRDEVAGTLDPNQLAENFSANHGAPVVGDDLFVESGNLRTIVLKMLYKMDLPKAAEYREWLAKNSERFGISQDALSKLKNPVLVRIRRTSLRDLGIDRAQFARDANAPFEAQMSTVEQAKADAAAMSSDLVGVLHPSETGEIFTQANQPFIQAFFDQVISPAARGGYMLADGSISQQGVRRIQNAVFAKAYPGAEAVLERLLDDPDNNIRNAARAMFAAAPKFAQMNDLIRTNTLRDLSLSADIGEAAKKLSSLRDAGQSVSDYLATGQMFGPDISAPAREILRVFSENSRRPMVVADIFNTYADEAMRAGRTDQGAMFGMEEVSKEGILRGAIGKVTGGGLFPGGEAGKAADVGAMSATPGKGGQAGPVPPSTGTEPGKPPQEPASRGTGAGPAIPEPPEPLSETGKGIASAEAGKASDADAVQRLVVDYTKTLGGKNGRAKLENLLKQAREDMAVAEDAARKMLSGDPDVVGEIYTPQEIDEAEEAGFDTPEKLLEQAKKVNEEWRSEIRPNIEALQKVLGEKLEPTPERIERRRDTERRKRIDQMTAEEMKKELLTSSVTGLPNRRAFDEAPESKAVAISDADGLKAFNDKFGYEAGNELLRAKAEALEEAGLEAYHDKGDEFLYRGKSVKDLEEKLEKARQILRDTVIEVTMEDGSVRRFKGADFSYGRGKDLTDAEARLKEHKTEREARGERARGELRGIAEVGAEKGEEREGGKEEEKVTPPDLEEPKKGYGDKNKIVTKDRYEELKKKLLSKGLGRSSAGLDPTVLSDVVEMMTYHMEAGIREFADLSARLYRDMGTWIKPYLQPAWDSLHGKAPEEARETQETISKLRQAAEQTGQLGLFGEVPSERAKTTERGRAPDEAPRPEERPRVEPSSVSAAKPAVAGEHGRAERPVRPGGEGQARGRSAERNRAVRDVPDAKLAPAIERKTPPSWEEAEWKGTMKQAGLPENARIPTRRLYRQISDKLIFTGQDAVADFALSELVDGSGGVVIATSTGTGKTYVSNAVLRQLSEMQPESMKRVLVLTKNQDLIKDFKSTASLFGNEVEDLPKGSIPQKDGTFISTYATAIGREGLSDFPWDFVIADESGEARRWYASRQGAFLQQLGERAKKVMYMSATPFHNAVEVGYLTKLGAWKGSTFDEWVSQFGVHRDKASGEWRGHSNPRRVEKLRQQLMERGQMIDWPRNMEGYEANFAVVPVTPEHLQTMADAMRAWRMVADYYRRKQASKMVMAANGNAVTFLKHLIESFRLPDAIDIAKKYQRQGHQVVLFSERRSAVDELYDFVKQADQGTAGQIEKLMPKIESFSKQFREAFGDEIAIYTGELQPRERREELDAWNAGKKKVMFSTYGAGGIGVSMHDKVGNAPRAVIYLGPPWSGVAFDQAIGRPWRFGTMSNVSSTFLFSNTKPEVDLVASKISPRMQSLRAIVNGIREEDPIIRGLRDVDKALSYEHGQEQKDKIESFMERVNTSGLMSHKEIQPREAAEFMYQGMKIKKRVLPIEKTPEEPEKGGGTTLYSNPIFDPDAWKKYVVKDVAEMFARKVDPNLSETDRTAGVARKIAEEVFGGKEFSKAAAENLGTADAAMKFSKSVGELAADAASVAHGDPEPVVRDVLENAKEWLKTVPGGRDGVKLAQTADRAGHTILDWYFFSGRGLIEKFAKRAGSPEIGHEIVQDIMEYHTQQGLIAGPWEARFMDIRKKYNLKAPDFEHVWDVVEGEAEPRTPNMEEAANEIRNINKEIQQEMVKHGVTVTAFNRVSGRPSQFAFPSRPRPNYMPRIYDEEVFQFGSKKREQIIQRMMQRKGISRVEAEMELDKKNNPETPLAGNIERAREADIEGYERTVNAYLKYLDGAAEVLARTKIFGQNRGILNGKVGMIDSMEARRDINEILDSLLSRNRFMKGPSDILQFASDWTLITKMPFTAIKMLAHMPKAAVMTNTRSFLEALVKTVSDYPQAYREALAGSGAVLHQARVDMMRDFGTSHRIGDKVLRLYQVAEADTLSRVLSDQTARVYLNRYALPELIQNPKSDYRRVLKEHFGLSESAIDHAIEKKQWAKEDLNRAGSRVAAKSQGTWDPTELPPGWRTVPNTKAAQMLAASVRMSVMLKAYIYKNGIFFRDMLWREARQGNFRPFVPFLLIFPALGEAIEDLSEAARGNPQRFKELMESKTYEPANLLKRIAGDLAFNTATNLVTTMVEGVTRYHQNPWASLVRSAEGPFWGDMHVFIADLMQSVRDLVEGRPGRLLTIWNSFGRRLSPAYRTVSTLAGSGKKGEQESPEVPELTLGPTPE